MIISHEHKFIFLKTRKTAGTSMEIALSQHCGPRDVITRISPEDETTRRELGFRGPRNYFLPFRQAPPGRWPQLLSPFPLFRYYNHVPGRVVQRHVGEELWKDYFVFCFERNPFDRAISFYYYRTKSKGDRRPALSEVLRHSAAWRLSNWHIYAIDDRVAVDFVGRYENLKDDLKTAWQKIGLPGEPTMVHAKSSVRTDRRPYQEVFDDESRSIIERVCAREIEHLGYGF